MKAVEQRKSITIDKRAIDKRAIDKRAIDKRAIDKRAIDKRAIESEFPVLEVSRLAEKESWRKEVNRPIYHIHKWWAKRLGSVFRAITLAALAPEKCHTWQDFYVKQDFRGKVVFDPFMGSGTTLGESLKLGCKVIGCDINPVSTFLVQQALTSVDEHALRSTFAQLKQDVAKEIQHYYRTRDPETAEWIPVLYYFWVKIALTPTYFDFIHYSELSDFFFAWLSPVLKDRYSFFRCNDSSHISEVQHSDPRLFAQQLSRVFAECNRTLKRDGLLVFSFHHSRSEGWAAIYEAVHVSGFKVVAAHPVHAEMKVASPKTSVKEPISLDAILVCRKSEGDSNSDGDIIRSRVKADKLEQMFESSGIKLSQSDRFVIRASQLLVEMSNQSTSFENMNRLLQEYAAMPCKPIAEEQV
jgi:adenine-specific DNA methylase